MTPQSPLHPLLLLTDSALPLGSFAFSSGLESYLAHHPPSPSPLTHLHTFLHASLHNTASTSLPYVLAGHRCATLPDLEDLDNDFDASTTCAVARRASVSQGRALLGWWERAVRGSAAGAAGSVGAAGVVEGFARGVRGTQAAASSEMGGWGGGGLQAHFAPLFGVVCAAMGVSEADAAYVFVWNHAKAVVSAAVRAGVVGPYQSQRVLAEGALQAWVRGCVEREAGKGTRDAGVSVPVVDVWVGRHEVLYSRIFNS